MDFAKLIKHENLTRKFANTRPNTECVIGDFEVTKYQFLTVIRVQLRVKRLWTILLYSPSNLTCLNNKNLNTNLNKNLYTKRFCLYCQTIQKMS